MTTKELQQSVKELLAEYRPTDGSAADMDLYSKLIAAHAELQTLKAALAKQNLIYENGTIYLAISPDVPPKYPFFPTRMLSPRT